MDDKPLLNQNSSNKELKTYFEKIFELQKSGEDFPVDLDEVWPIVYARRDNAVRELKDKFLQDIDYQVFHQNVENPLGGRPTKKYRLSVACLEYFIARKIRPVFEVYRRATHEFNRVIGGQMTSDLPDAEIFELLDLKYQALKAQQHQIAMLTEKVETIESRTQTRPECFTVVAYTKYVGKQLSLGIIAAIGRKATNYCKKNNIEIDKIWDTRYGHVNVYPKEVLEQIFNDLF